MKRAPLPIPIFLLALSTWAFGQRPYCPGRERSENECKRPAKRVSRAFNFRLAHMKIIDRSRVRQPVTHFNSSMHTTLFVV